MRKSAHVSSITALIVCGFLFPGYTFASNVIIQQPLATVDITSFATSPTLGTGISGTVGVVQVGFAVQAVSNNQYLRVGCFTTSSYVTPCSGTSEFNFYFYGASQVADNQPRLYIATSSDYVLTFDATKYYKILQYPESPGTAHVYGTSTALTSLAYVFYDTGSTTIPTVSGINSISSPTPGQVTSTAFPQLTFSYSNFNTYVVASADITDLTSNASITVPEETITANGTFTYSETLNLYASHYYSVNPYIEDAFGNRLYGQSVVYFSTVTNVIPANFVTEDELTAAASTTGYDISKSITLWSIIRQRPPFLWFVQVSDAVASSTGASAETLPTLTISTGTSSVAVSAVLFSTTTLTSMMGTVQQSRYYAIMSAAIWLYIAYAVIRKVGTMFTTKEEVV